MQIVAFLLLKCDSSSFILGATDVRQGKANVLKQILADASGALLIT